MKYLLFVIFTLASFLGNTQVDKPDSTASCVAYWEKGEKKTFLITHAKEKNVPGKTPSNSSLTYEAYVVILDSSSSGYKVQWTFQLPAVFKAKNPSLAGLLPVFDGLKIIFKTTEEGAFIELLNWEEVRDAFVKMMEVSLPKRLDSAGKVALEKSKAVFNSKEMVESSMINEIKIFHLPYGFKYSTTAIKEITEIASPFGSEPLPASQVSQVTELDPKQDYFKLAIKEDIDKEGAARLFEALLKKVDMSQDSISVEERKIISSIEISDYKEYQISQSTGWVKKVIYKRTVKSSEMSQVDSYVIEMKH